jgi:hypothetical protein
LVDRDTILAVLQTGIGLAGLLLIFSGFLVSKADSYGTRRGDKYKWLAIGTLVPVLGALALSWLSIDALQGGRWAQYHLVTVLRIQLAVTGVFAIIGLISVAS